MNRKKILLVEDSPLPQRIVKSILENLHCEVDIVETGEDGVALCMENHFDLVLMDIGLPGIDGIMAAQLIREQESPGCHVPIVALTAHDDPDLKARALQAGMDDYRVKPLSSAMAQEILIKYGRKINSAVAHSKRKRG